MWIPTDWYKVCKHSVTCVRTFFADFIVHTVKLKPIIKAQISGKLVTSGISDDVATASVHSEKTRLKKLIMVIIIIITENPYTSKWKRCWDG